MAVKEPFVEKRLQVSGGSSVLTIPAHIMKLAGMQPRSSVIIQAEGDRIVIAKATPRVTLDDILARCDASVPVSADELNWMKGAPVGDEVL